MLVDMYQNAPHYNQGYTSPSPQGQYGGGGYYGNNDMQQHPPPAYPGGQYGAPSPVNSAYQRANAAMAGMPPSQRGVSPSPPQPAGGGAATGLIRLTLRKPMGIVFEPMTDPHNPSQQRGVRICDLPRTGAAAMSQKLEVGDELLSINDKTMSRLTFDEIMDFIIEADKERVDLLFRRPKKDELKQKGTPGADATPTGQPLSPMGLGGLGSHSNSVKWIDEKSDMGGKIAEDVREPERDDRRGGRNASRERGSDRKQVRQDDPSVDDTYNDGYTVESQSQYTMETYEDDRRGGGRGGRGDREADSRYSEDESNVKPSHSRGGRGGRNDRNDKRKSGDPVESSGFLDLLIDTLCTSVMGRDAREMCGDRSGNIEKGNDARRQEKNKYAGDDEYTVDDEGTYATYEDQVNDHGRADDRRGASSDHHRNAGGNNRHHHHHQQEPVDEESLATEGEQTFTTMDDGTQTQESKEVINTKSKKQPPPPQPSHPIQNHLHSMSINSEKKREKEQIKNSLSKHSARSKDRDDPIMNLTPHTPHQEEMPMEEEDDMDDRHEHHQYHHDDRPQDKYHGGRRAQDPSPTPPSFDQMTAPDPPTKGPSNASIARQQEQLRQQEQRRRELEMQQQHEQQQRELEMQYHDQQMIDAESAMDPNMPLKELEYDQNYAADVSVMESLGGPSLLVERARHENAATSGHDRAAFENLDRQDPELGVLVAAHGREFAPDPGMSREETAFRDPYKFYEHAVCQLLRENEPEKVRLLSKLMAKYRGRERHLINKLSARYNKDKGHQDVGGGIGGGGGSGEREVAASSSAGGEVRSKMSAGEASNANNLANKPSMSGMEKIHEGGEDEEAGSSVLNDPSRANIAAIESAKKKLESVSGSSSNNEAPPPQVHVVAPSSSGGAASQSQEVSLPKAKPSNDDGWPPAMSDPWGTGGGGGGGGGNAPPSSQNNDSSRPPTHIENKQMDDSRPMIMSDDGSYSDGSSYSAEESEGVDGTSPAIIAQVSELLNYVYGKTSVAGQIDRVSTIMRAYEGREAVLLELLETKALIKANADTNRENNDLPTSLRNNAGLNDIQPSSNKHGGGDGNNGANVHEGSAVGMTDRKKLTPQTPVSVLTTPTIEPYPPNQASPASAVSPREAVSPSLGTLNTMNTLITTNTAGTSKKKKKKIFGGFFGGKKKGRGGGNFPGGGSETIKTSSSPGKGRSKRIGKKGLPLNEEDRSI